MALVRDFEVPGTGLVVTNAYHVIVKVNTEKRLNDIPAPPDPTRPDGITAGDRGHEVYWRAGYVGRIAIEIFLLKKQETMTKILSEQFQLIQLMFKSMEVYHPTLNNLI
jgi:hypothetical protein